MKIFVTAKLKAREARCEEVDATHFVVAVKEPPIEGRANQAIAETLAGHFGIAISRITLISGRSSRRKVFDVL